MRVQRIRQLERLIRGLQSDGYEVSPIISTIQKRLTIRIKLNPDEGEEIMAKWNDLRRIEGG